MVYSPIVPSVLCIHKDTNQGEVVTEDEWIFYHLQYTPYLELKLESAVFLTLEYQCSTLCVFSVLLNTFTLCEQDQAWETQKCIANFRKLCISISLIN